MLTWSDTDAKSLLISINGNQNYEYTGSETLKSLKDSQLKTTLTHYHLALFIACVPFQREITICSTILINNKTERH